MPLTVEQIVEETRHWPPARLAELVDSLSVELHQGTPPEVDAAWKQEARRRLAEIEDGLEQPVDGEEVSAQVRRIVGL
jgi:Putative addiction module component